MSYAPLVSLVMVVKNGMPHLPEAIASIAAQTYRNFELVIQDGVSTDGTLEFLQTVEGIPDLRLQSQRDGGANQAFNRALSRCSGDIIGTIDDDNLMEPDALQTIVEFFAAHPECAAVYGNARMIDSDGSFLHNFDSDEFDLLHVLNCKLIPALAVSFFSKSRCEELLVIDESLSQAYDYELWLRLGHLPVCKIPAILGSVRRSPESNTCQAALYDQICQGKIAIAENYLSQLPASPLTDQIRKHAIAGIYAWAAESMRWVPDATPEQLQRYREKALAVDPLSDRIRALDLGQKADDFLAAWQQTNDRLAEVQVERDQVRAELGARQAEVNQLKQTIAAMETSKFWQLRMAWVRLKERLLPGKAD